MLNSDAMAESGTELLNSTVNMDRVFDLQMANRLNLANTSAEQRIAKLKKLLQWIFDHREEIRDAHYQDFRKPAAEVDVSEIYVVVIEIRHAIRHLRKWMKPKRVPRTLQLIANRAWIRYAPRGVVLIISPWNFPFNLAVGPLVSAIAAGNAVIMKPSEFSPKTSQLVSRMVTELFPENEVAVFEGDKEVAAALLKKPFHHIFFTGSTRVGKVVMKAAADNLAGVTLELGGKSPVIVDETADLEDAAKKIAWGKYMNAGQTCIAPDYLLIHENVYEPFMNLFRKTAAKYYGSTEGERQSSPDFARVINWGHFDRLSNMIRESNEAGATVEIGGTVNKQERYISPTVLTNVDLKSAVMQEEIFGPILPVVRYKLLDDALNIINERGRPLNLSIFSKNQRTIDAVISHTASGSSCINDVVVQFIHSNLPFGGINQSGFGNSHGFYGFRAFSYERAVLKGSRFTPLKLLFPPYNSTVRKLIDFLVKHI